MNKLISILNKIGQRKDIMLAVMLLAIVFMMILPLPTALVDVLIGANMSIAVVLLMLADGEEGRRLQKIINPSPILLREGLGQMAFGWNIQSVSLNLRSATWTELNIIS